MRSNRFLHQRKRIYKKIWQSGSLVLSDVLPAFCKVQQLHSTCHSAWAGQQSPVLRVSECDLVAIQVDLQLASSPFYEGKIIITGYCNPKRTESLAPRVLSSPIISCLGNGGKSTHCVHYLETSRF